MINSRVFCFNFGTPLSETTIKMATFIWSLSILDRFFHLPLQLHDSLVLPQFQLRLPFLVLVQTFDILSYVLSALLRCFLEFLLNVLAHLLVLLLHFLIAFLHRLCDVLAQLLDVFAGLLGRLAHGP